MRISDWSSDVCSSDLLWRNRAVECDIERLCRRLRFIDVGPRTARPYQEFGSRFRPQVAVDALQRHRRFFGIMLARQPSLARPPPLNPPVACAPAPAPPTVPLVASRGIHTVAAGSPLADSCRQRWRYSPGAA